jgi:hypothetical protein
LKNGACLACILLHFYLHVRIYHIRNAKSTRKNKKFKKLKFLISR